MTTKDLINQLRSQAVEIASAGHAGWGNTMLLAAQALAVQPMELSRGEAHGIIRCGEEGCVVCAFENSRQSFIDALERQGKEENPSRDESGQPIKDSELNGDERGRCWGAGFCPHPGEPCVDGCYYCGRPVGDLSGDHNHTEYEKGKYSCVCEDC